MSTLVPATLALLGLGMFAGSIWLQEVEARPRIRRDVAPVTAPADGIEEEVPEAALSHYPLMSH